MADDHASRVQFGCGRTAPAEWCNFDSSMRLRLERLPPIGTLVPAGAFGRFPANVRYGDIVKGLPLPDGHVDLLYCSHVLEHLSLADFRTALRNCRRLLEPDGVFRIVMPDLRPLMERYVASADPDAAVTFMKWTGLGRERPQGGLVGRLVDSLRNSQHLWLWDYESAAAELETAGFRGIRRACFGDSGIAAFAAVESRERWDGFLGIHCRA